MKHVHGADFGTNIPACTVQKFSASKISRPHRAIGTMFCTLALNLAMSEFATVVSESDGDVFFIVIREQFEIPVLTFRQCVVSGYLGRGVLHEDLRRCI